MFYGGLQEDKHQRPLQKHYSADGSMEIKRNTQTGEVEFITYIGGDAYSTPLVLKSDGTAQEYLFLHRDYQGSILAITNEQGTVIEKRQFDAWGQLVKVQDQYGKVLDKMTVLDRGYTGHEHLQSIGIIHMNGRLYDGKLHRFLQPDNFVQDPYNTQNFNRYGYVLNNPLKYTDPSGELFSFLVGLVEGVANVFTHGVNFDNYDWDKTRNAWRIDMGLFKSDSNRTFWGQFIQVFGRFTWELPQTLIGNTYTHFMNVSGHVDRVDYFGGATFATNENSTKRHGLSMGNYINIDIKDNINGDFTTRVLSDPLYMHEYGHTFDSQIFGPVYLLAIGIPSFISASYSKQIENEPYGVTTHDMYWSERRANKHASKYFKKYYNINWDNYEVDYPTKKR